jgi:Na+-driven multidrug efflux pump
MISYSVETFWWLIIPYIGFGIGTILRSVFYGTGQTRYIFYIACFVNIGMIVPFVALVLLGIVPASFTSIMLFYMIAFLVDPLLAYIGVKRVISQKMNLSG